MAFCSPSSSTLSMHGRGSPEDGLRKKSKLTFSVDVSASSCGNVNVTTETSMQCGVVLDERLWKCLPEEILDIIVTRLPYAAQCRLRCVSRKWKGIQSLQPPPTCPIMSRLGDSNPRFFCDSEKKWCSLPSNAYLPTGPTWELVDVDAGLVCYQSSKDACGLFWLWVCNPLKPSSSRLVKPTYPRWDIWNNDTSQPPKIKLLVDRANKTFKVVLDPVIVGWTAAYESTSSRWTVHNDSFPRITSHRFFVWENVIYASGTTEKLPHEFYKAWPTRSTWYQENGAPSMRNFLLSLGFQSLDFS